VLDVWRKQGLPAGVDPGSIFPTDPREEILLDLEPRPRLKKWPSSCSELGRLQRKLDPHDPQRLPEDWARIVGAGQKEDPVRMLRVHRGFFISMGVDQWDRFTEVMVLLSDDPKFVRQLMVIQGEFVAELTERVLREIDIDAAIFSEPIGGNDRPLISPRMYEEFVLKSYQPILDVLKRNAVETIILRTYANARVLLPSIVKWGFNCLWACEVNLAAMDYRDLRREYGRDLRLIGGIDLDALRRGKAAIRREVLDKVPPLLADGGYVPLADGRIREDVPYDRYVYYRQELEKVTKGL
jgi:uroporphyrinogen decarboxylase